MAVEDICDMARLRRSNDLAWKWFSRTGLYKNQYIPWVINLQKEPNAFKSSLSPSFKSAFTKDFKEMFYAAEVENDIIKQYDRMVHYCMKKIRHIPCQEDDMYSTGLITIRNCIWQYRNLRIKCSFTTYCHNSVWMRMSGDLCKQRMLFKKRSKEGVIRSSTDISEEFDLENIAGSFGAVHDDETKDLITALISRMNLKEDEKYLFYLLIERTNHKKEDGVWYKSYLEKFKHCFPNSKITKEGLRQRVLKLQKKVWFQYRDMNNLPFQEMPKPKMKTAI
jgi:hypothetical protein